MYRAGGLVCLENRFEEGRQQVHQGSSTVDNNVLMISFELAADMETAWNDGVVVLCLVNWAGDKPACSRGYCYLEISTILANLVWFQGPLVASESHFDSPRVFDS